MEEEPVVSRADPGCSWKTEDVCNISTPIVLAQNQQSGKGAVAIVYKVVKQDTELMRETLERGSLELKQLYKMRDTRSTLCGKPTGKWRVICPEISRNVVIWTTHRQAHSGISRMTNRIKMTWYWPGMTADICPVIRTCEICQMAKS